MPKKIPEIELESIVAIVAAHPEGVQVKVIRDGLESKLPPRMLQRRLALLISQNRLVVVGRGRGSRYQLPMITGTAHLVNSNDRVEARGEIYVPISSEGKAIRQAVREPIQNRIPIGYNRSFLDEYRPNDSFYLSGVTRQHLFEIGRSPDSQRLAGTYIRKIYDRLLIDLSWNSSRLEGNTYSLLDTQRLLEQGEVADGKGALEAQMILNHKAAIELIVDQTTEVGFNRYTILNLHALLSDNLLADPQACGRLRTRTVEISGTVYHPLDVPQTIDECFQQILDTAAAIIDPFEQAFFAMVHLPYLQPFDDVNKRVSRLTANLPLIRENLSPLSFVDVPEKSYVEGLLGVYEINRIELLRDVFVWAYERSCARYSAMRQSLGEPDPFRLRYRPLLMELVSGIVRGCMDKSTAVAFIKQRAAEDSTREDQARFIEVAETELMGLHEGNIARYRLHPSEYQTWRKTWR
jgi:hypothetical protein